MKPLAVIALCLPLALGVARAANTPACASLCGEWRLDAAASDKPEPLLDAAFRQFKEPRERRPSRVFTDNIDELGKAADEEALGPILDRPRSRELREELRSMLRQPGQLGITGNALDIRITGDGGTGNSYTAGERHTRVDAYGTARIEARWRGQALVLGEKYDRRNQQETSYSVGKDGALHVLQVIARQGLPRITLRSVYRRP